MWAATHGQDFDSFKLILYPGIEITCGMNDGIYYRPYVHVAFFKPRVFYDVSIYAADKYAKLNGISTKEFHVLDDIPF